MAHQTAAASTAAWNTTADIIDSGDVAKLSQVIQEYPDTNAAEMAGLVLGDSHLAAGCNQLFVNKATAQDDLNKAIAAYQQVLDKSKVPSFRERATFGLARATEAKGQAPDLKQAEKLYAEVVSTWPHGAFAEAAQQRLDDLKRPETKRIYDRFAKFDPKPAFSSEPAERPAFDMNSLPREAPAQIPAPTDDLDFGLKGAGKANATENKSIPGTTYDLDLGQQGTGKAKATEGKK